MCTARPGRGAAAGNRPDLLAVAVQTADPGNAGTLVRLADAAGADGVMFVGDTVDPFGPKAVRAAAGSTFHLPLAQAPEPAALPALLTGAGLSVLATAGSADLTLDHAAAGGVLDLPTAWLFGSEAHGLPASCSATADAWFGCRSTAAPSRSTWRGSGDLPLRQRQSPPARPHLTDPSAKRDRA